MDCVASWARCLWLAAVKDHVSLCQRADLSVSMYLHWDTHTHTQRMLGQHNSCTADMMVVTCSHPIIPPGRERMVAIVSVCLCECTHSSKFLCLTSTCHLSTCCMCLTEFHLTIWHVEGTTHPDHPAHSGLNQTLQTLLLPFLSSHHLKSHCYWLLASRKSQKYLSEESRATRPRKQSEGSVLRG